MYIVSIQSSRTNSKEEIDISLIFLIEKRIEPSGLLQISEKIHHIHSLDGSSSPEEYTRRHMIDTSSRLSSTQDGECIPSPCRNAPEKSWTSPKTFSAAFARRDAHLERFAPSHPARVSCRSLRLFPQLANERGFCQLTGECQFTLRGVSTEEIGGRREADIKVKQQDFREFESGLQAKVNARPSIASSGFLLPRRRDTRFINIAELLP